MGHARVHEGYPLREPEVMHVPGGAFLMGTNDEQIEWLAQRLDEARVWQQDGRFAREQPPHEVSLPGFEIGRYPLTVGEYRAFVEAGGYAERSYWTGCGWDWREAQDIRAPRWWESDRWAGHDRLPVIGVSWYEALAYCRWLSSVTGRACGLPTEAQWERAARGADGRLYPWGDAPVASHSNTRASGPGQTLPVGRHSPAGDSPYGCAEMGGNASEWTLSRYRPYPYQGDDGRNDVAGEAERVIRGGSWFKPLLRARAAARGMNDPLFRDHDVGFRLACSRA
jgi:formylglycine-generating enzyme required for sulfatase activity